MRFIVSTGSWQFWSLAALALLVLTAVITDVRERRIPNALVLVALVTGLLVHLLGPKDLSSGGGLFTASAGALGLKGTLLGALTGLALFLPMYLLRAMGGGDVKLMAAIGSFAGPLAIVDIALCVLLAGGLLALARMLVAQQSQLVMRNMLHALGQFLPGSAGTFEAATQSVYRMPYGVAIAAGLLGYGIWIYTGHAPLIRF